MAGATTTTGVEAIRKYLTDRVNSTIVRDRGMLNGIIPIEYRPTDQYIRETIYANSSNTAANYNENAAYPAAGCGQTYDQYIAWTHSAATVSLSGPLLRAASGGYFDIMNVEIEKGMNDLKGLICSDMITQMEAAIDSSTAYGSLVRATVGNASYEHALSGSLTYAELELAYETLAGASYRAPMNDMMILSEINQIGNYSELMGVPGLDYSMAVKDDTLNVGRIRPNVKFQQVPWYHMPGMTNTTILLMPRTEVAVVFQTQPMVVVEPHQLFSDSQTWVLRSSYGFVMKNGLHCGKITSVTA